jgi:hypothetical protein
MGCRFMESGIEEGYCVCGILNGYDEDFQIHEGTAVAGEFPDDARFTMSDDFPKDILLPDMVENASGLVLVSSRLKSALLEAAPGKVEYLRVSIFNHKKRLASDDYHIVNALDIVDAIDFKKSRITWNALDPEDISTCESLVLDPARIPPKAGIFRLKSLSGKVALGAKAAETLAKGKFVGLNLVEADGFSGF